MSDKLPERVWCHPGIAGLGEWEHNNREGGEMYVRGDIVEQERKAEILQILTMLSDAASETAAFAADPVWKLYRLINTNEHMK